MNLSTDQSVINEITKNLEQFSALVDLYNDGLADEYQSVIDGGGAASYSGGVKMTLSPTGRLLLAYGLGRSVVAHIPRSTVLKGGLGRVYVDDEDEMIQTDSANEKAKEV